MPEPLNYRPPEPRSRWDAFTIVSATLVGMFIGYVVFGSIASLVIGALKALGY